MNKKYLILGVSVMAAFFIVVAVSLYFLYSGSEKSKNALASDRNYALLSAVPSDAVMFFRFSDLGTAADAVCSPESSLHFFSGNAGESSKFLSFLKKFTDSPLLNSSETVISIHFVGDLVPLLVLDAGRAESEPSDEISSFLSAASQAGLFAKYVDGSQVADDRNMLRKRSLLLVSPSDILVYSSERHLKRDESILGSTGVSESLMQVSGENVMVIPNSNVRKIFSDFIRPAFRADADFLAKFSDCVALNIDSYSSGHLSLNGKSYATDGPRSFLNVYQSVSPSKSQLSAVIPSYAIFAASVPLDNVSRYQEAYVKFAETLSLSKTIEEERGVFKKRYGIDPKLWAESLNLKEVAVSVFKAGDKLEKVLMLRPGNTDRNIIFKGLDVNEIKKYNGEILPYRYQGMASLLFGSLFSASDESSFIFKEGWIIAGSKSALDEYVSGRALEYRLKDYFSDAEVEDRISSEPAYFVSYFSAAEEAKVSDDLFQSHFSTSLKSSAKGITFEPVFLVLSEGRQGVDVCFNLERKTVLKTKAPVFERDTVVVVPAGPFKVKNSGTGRTNLFYQQDNLYLCLQEENGKGLWGVPFSSRICGNACTIDYFANGKLQILFASGSKLHLIDRLGRFVNPFPVNLGKEVLLGPDAYDFSGKKKYNVMVLHKDNTVEMYNLQGKKPAQWKGIAPKETIKKLPERIFAGNSSYWVVRTSIQTLIYPFYGGEPLTVAQGDKMIRPDSKIVPQKGSSVEVTCYDGKKRVFDLGR